MEFPPLDFTAPHLSYLLISTFLLIYALFSVFIRNKLHLSEPPLALLTGIIFGPQGFDIIRPRVWGIDDSGVQEITRLIVGLQVFAIGLELPRRYMPRHWKSLFWLLGPVMTFGWFVCAGLVSLIFGTSFAEALILSACLTPTDPILAATVVGDSCFSARVPKRIQHLLSAESGCNDGISFPFLYLGMQIIINTTAGGTVKSWLLLTVFWQCLLGTLVGAVLGYAANHVLRFSDRNKLVASSSFIVFYLLLALLSIGIASNLGLDDFLVAFAAGAAFSHDGWFAKRTRKSSLNAILDLITNSTFFVLFGALIPWHAYVDGSITPLLTPGRLVLFLVLVLLLRRIPIVVALKSIIPDIKTYREALFAGHFGPMGVGGLFLAIEARAFLDTGTSQPLPNPDPSKAHYRVTPMLWPIISFVVVGSTIVHGLSPAAVSLYSYCARRFFHRQDSIEETEPLHGMQHSDSEDELDQSESSEDEAWTEQRRQASLLD